MTGYRRAESSFDSPDILGQLQGSAPSAWSVSLLLVAVSCIGSEFGSAAC
jgi:hypothetical protein